MSLMLRLMMSRVRLLGSLVRLSRVWRLFLLVVLLLVLEWWLSYEMFYNHMDLGISLLVRRS
jgi:hypothetical protein